jgi:hypothetical protein
LHCCPLGCLVSGMPFRADVVIRLFLKGLMSIW